LYYSLLSLAQPAAQPCYRANACERPLWLRHTAGRKRRRQARLRLCEVRQHGHTPAPPPPPPSSSRYSYSLQHNKMSSHRRWSHTKELATSWHGRPLY
jgi:hypothetical protein